MIGKANMHNSIPREFGTQNKFLNLPDTSYWLSREEIILSYLFQRNAAVPQVLKKDLVDNTLTMRHVGHSADELTRTLSISTEADQAALHILKQTIDALLNIHHLGVQHLDVALRNIATTSFNDVDVRILDFTHALSENHNLQKPLPLIPTVGLHHERLINALIKDWNDYFYNLGRNPPLLNEDLNISNYEFTSYWTDTTNVQLLCNDSGILSHSISNLTLEIANSLISDPQLSHVLLKHAYTMRHLPKDSGHEAIDSMQSLISTLIKKQGYNHPKFSNATPIPKITPERIVKSPQVRTSSSPIFHATDLNQLLSLKRRLFKSKLFVSVLWLAALFNVLYIDHVVTHNSYVLSNSALYACIGTLFLSPLLMLFCYLFKPRVGQILSRVSLLFLTATQFIVVVDCIPLSTTNLSTWFFTLLLMIASLFSL